MRLIDAEALPEIKIHVGGGLYSSQTVSDRINGALIIARNNVARAPTIDAVPVVRCKDCRWYDSAFSACDKYSYCVCEDFYCANGEREA